MSSSMLSLIVLGLALAGMALGYRRSLAQAGGRRRVMHSVPFYHGAYVALMALLPAFLVFLAATAFRGYIVDFLFVGTLSEEITGQDRPLNLILTEIKNAAAGQTFGEPSEAVEAAAERLAVYQTVALYASQALVLLVGSAGFVYAFTRISPAFRARNRVEAIVHLTLLACALVAIATTIGIVIAILTEALRFFAMVPAWNFLTGTTWNPSSAIRETQAVGQASFGFLPLLGGTLLITAVALSVAVPLGLLIAIFLAEYLPNRWSRVGKPVIETLSGIPTVVYGFFAALIVAPFLATWGGWIGLNVSYQAALAPGLVMGVMLIPFVSSLSSDVIASVSDDLREAAYMMGATHGEVVRRVVLPAALPGIVGAIVLAFSIAVGETMIVLMAAGLSANLTANPLEPVTTITVQIANILTGDQPFGSATTLSAYALALVLFVLTLAANYASLRVVDRYRN